MEHNPAPVDWPFQAVVHSPSIGRFAHNGLAFFTEDLSDALAERIYIQLDIFVGLVSSELLLAAPGLPDFGETRFF
jgi:hypothetical protein